MGFIRTIIDRVQSLRTENEGSRESPPAVRLKLKLSESKFHSYPELSRFSERVPICFCKPVRDNGYTI